jgi:hypothetical protein
MSRLAYGWTVIVTGGSVSGSLFLKHKWSVDHRLIAGVGRCLAAPAGISASDVSGGVAIACWNRLSLVQLYLGMLAARKPPSIKFVLSNLPAIVKVRFVGRRETWQLLEQLARSGQIHELNTTRGWIEIAFTKLCFMKKRLDVARQHLKRANTAALAQDSAALFDEIKQFNVLLS